MKFNFRVASIVFLIGFICFFGLRLVYGYIAYPNGEKLSSGYSYANRQPGFTTYKSRNIAGKSFKKIPAVTQGAPISVDQRYEKIANMSMVSDEFDEDSKTLRNTIKKYKALIQYEQSSGLKGVRVVHLALGVNPNDFDTIIAELKILATLKSLQVNKTDKTNEYKSLQATQISLTKSRDALLKLKSHEAKVAELIGLESRILEVEQRIQKLGVNLGEFDAENEFVTVKLTLSEIPKSKFRNIAMIKRAFTAIVWAVKYYALFIFAFMMFLIAALGFIKIVEIATRLKTRAN